MEKIVRISRALKVLFSVLVVIAPVLMILYWGFFNQLLELKSTGVLYGVKVADLPIKAPVSAWVRLLGFMAACPSLAVDLYALLKLRRLFALYARGQIFEKANVGCIKALGYALLAGQALSPVSQALLTLVLTFSNPKGQRMVEIGLSDANLTALVCGVMIIVVAFIMDEGRKLQEEQSLTI